MLRILLFLGTNIAILAVLSVTMKILGVEELLVQNGVDMNLTGLLIMSAVLGFAGSLISLFMSKSMAKRGMKVQLIEQPANQTEQWIRDTVADQARRLELDMPEVGIFDSAAPNAFATGWNRNNALVAVSSGLLQTMNRDEVEAVLGHEMAHVANGDMVTLTLIQGVVNTFVIFLSRIIGHTVDKVIFKSERGYGPGYWITSMIAQFLLGILAMMIVAWFSRWREFRADAGGAALAGRQKMINSLRRLQQASNPQPLPDEMEAFGFFGGKMQALFSTHPPLEVRIQALQEA
ncbi:MAG: protease HtpX [bacterium]